MPKTHISQLYRPPLGLVADLYHLTMAYGYWKNGLAERGAAFHLFFRRAPFGQPYALASGLDLVIDLLQAFSFSVNDIQYLGALRGASGKPLFDEAFLNYLQRTPFRCSIDAVPEGTVVFPHQPLVRAEGPLLQVQIIESALLNLINFSSLIATKASRMVALAGEEGILEFGLRRAQGLDGAITASRAAFVGGCAATSNLMAGRYYGIPVRGTHAHSWVMVFENELASFRAFAQALPDNCVFLVDTYDTLRGVRHAIRVAREMRAAGHQLNGIRLDSGDLAALSRQARTMLDEAGFPEVAIVASDSMDEYRIRAMQEKGAAISIWGIGTRLVTAQDDPALGGVYKLAALQGADGVWDDRIKLSEEALKTSIPGRQQVKRFFDASGRPAGDMTYDPYREASSQMVAHSGGTLHDFTGAEGKDLLIPIFSEGRLVYEAPTLPDIRRYCLEQQARFRTIPTERYPHGLEKSLYERKNREMEQARQENQGPP